MDVLRASGVAIDLVIDDFQAYYPQFPWDLLEHGMHVEMASSRGCEVNWRAAFGATHLPEKLNRANFAVCQLIDQRLWEAQSEFQ